MQRKRGNRLGGGATTGTKRESSLSAFELGVSRLERPVARGWEANSPKSWPIPIFRRVLQYLMVELKHVLMAPTSG